MRIHLPVLGLALAAGGRAGAPAPDRSVREGTAHAPDGLPIVYDVRGTGDTTLVFVHCWCGNRSFWKHQLDAFAPDYRVVALDVGGHGASGKARSPWTIASLGGDVKAVADELGLERMVLIGHSMGGPASLEAARLMPGRVIGIVGVDNLHDADMQFPPEMLEGMAVMFERDFRGTMQGFVRQMIAPPLDEELLRFVVDEACASDPAAVLAIFRSIQDVDIGQMLSQAGCRVRCINATPMGTMGARTAVETNRKYCDFDVVLMEGVGHYLQLEEPAEFNLRLSEVLTSLTAPGGAR
jgi:pimeloyl-ACP methyl ester carboxylesterase